MNKIKAKIEKLEKDAVYLIVEHPDRLSESTAYALRECELEPIKKVIEEYLKENDK